MGNPKIILQDKVPEAWIDYNGHMNDVEYVRTFSWGVDRFMELIGITDEFRETNQYTMYTMENHVCYLDEMKLGEPFEIHMQIIDYDLKRVHVFYELFGEKGKRAATSEQLIMGIDQSKGTAAPFPEAIFPYVQDFAKNHTPAVKPKEVGRVIGIRRKK